MVLKSVANNQRGRSTRGRGARRPRRQGGDSVGKYFGDAWSLAKRTAVGLNEIRKLINVEHKYVDTNTNSTTSVTGVVTYLNGIAQGDGISDRDGDSIRVLKFQIAGCVFRNHSSSANETVRVLVVRDLQNQGAIIVGTDVLETLGTSTAPYQFVDMLNGQFYNNRFTIVYDELFAINANDQNAPFRFETSHPCHIAFRGTTGTVASAGAGAYFLVAISNTGSDTPFVDFSSRIIYTDN